MSSQYKQMLLAASKYLTKYQQPNRDRWNPRVRQLIVICHRLFLEKQECTFLEIIASATLFAEDEVKAGRMEADALPEEIFLRFLMWFDAGMKWEPVLQDWISNELTLQQYCIHKKIPLFAIMTDPFYSKGVLVRGTSLDYKELLDKDLGPDESIKWFICNIAFCNEKHFVWNPRIPGWENVER